MTTTELIQGAVEAGISLQTKAEHRKHVEAGRKGWQTRLKNIEKESTTSRFTYDQVDFTVECPYYMWVHPDGTLELKTITN
jgi:hypothetical protein